MYLVRSSPSLLESQLSEDLSSEGVVFDRSTLDRHTNIHGVAALPPQEQRPISLTLGEFWSLVDLQRGEQIPDIQAQSLERKGLVSKGALTQLAGESHYELSYTYMDVSLYRVETIPEWPFTS